MTTAAISIINEKYPILLVDMIEDEHYYRDLIIALLKKHAIHNIRPFNNPEEYQRALEENPNLTPHIALVDFRFDGSDLTGLHITDTLIKRSKHKSLRTKVIMISDWNQPDDIRKFFHMGGSAWFHKDERDQMVAAINEFIVDIQEALEERAWIDGLEEDVSK